MRVLRMLKFLKFELKSFAISGKNYLCQSLYTEIYLDVEGIGRYYQRMQ